MESIEGRSALAAIVTAAAVTVSCGAQDSGPAEGGTGGSPSFESDAAAPVGTKCELPSIPVITGAGQVVGAGDPASCTQDALESALAEAGTIDFNCGTGDVVIPITRTLVVKDQTRLLGHGRVTLDGGDAVRIMRTESSSTVVLEGLRFRRGRAVAGASGENADGSGGAIYRGWQGTLDVRDCRFEGNSATADQGFGGGAIFAASSGRMTIASSVFEQNRSKLGGAIHTILSDLIVVDSVFLGNEATAGDGGAIFTDGGIVPQHGTLGAHDGIISLCGSRFQQNVATASAGAAFLFTYRDEASGKADKLEVRRCEFRSNRVTQADPGLGGAIRIDAVATISQCLFAENQCAGQGGALWMGRGPALFENTTFFANHADKWGGAISYGDKPITLAGCTLAHNTASEGSDCLFGSEGAATARNTLFFENGEAGSNRHCNRVLIGDHNMAFPTSDSDTCGPAVEHVDPKLEPVISDHGGFSDTLALLEGSPAIDRGAQCPPVDQRDEPRNKEQCDLGAYER